MPQRAEGVRFSGCVAGTGSGWSRSIVPRLGGIAEAKLWYKSYFSKQRHYPKSAHSAMSSWTSTKATWGIQRQ